MFLSAETLSGLGYFLNILFLVIGVFLLVKGADWFVASASSIAKKFKISALVIGLTVVAIGTSLPELVTSVMAAKKGENEIAVGNVVGSNIFNILFICGMSGVITPLTMSADIMTDMIISLGFTVLVFCFIKKEKLTKANGGLLVLCYVLYIAYIIIRLFVPQIVIPA